MRPCSSVFFWDLYLYMFMLQSWRNNEIFVYGRSDAYWTIIAMRLLLFALKSQLNKCQVYLSD